MTTDIWVNTEYNVSKLNVTLTASQILLPHIPTACRQVYAFLNLRFVPEERHRPIQGSIEPFLHLGRHSILNLYNNYCLFIVCTDPYITVTLVETCDFCLLSSS